MTKETLEKLIAAKPDNGIALLTVNLDNPTGYGRIIRENGNVVAIVEQKRCQRRAIKNSRSEYRRVSGRWCTFQKLAFSCEKITMHKASFI